MVHKRGAMNKIRGLSKYHMSMTEDLNIRSNKFVIIFANNCNIIISNTMERIEKGQIVLFERNINITLKITKFTDDAPYEYIELEKEDTDNVLKIMEPMYSLSQPDTIPCDLVKRIFIIDDDITAHYLFDKIKQNKNIRLKAYEIACLLSMTEEVDKVFVSLARSATLLFCDKIRKLIESDTAKKWQLSLISDEINISEVAIRKKLENEQTRFYQLLLDVRMQKAAKLILKNDLQIGKISKLVGISSVSYFIKVFRTYYGVTPKNYFSYHKEIIFNDFRKISETR